MCSGGVGSANNADNDNETGSGNSFKEVLANIFTPGDDMKYVDGRLTETNYADRDKKFYASGGGDGNNGSGYAHIDAGGKKKHIRRDANDKYKQRYASALFGAASGGLPGLLGSIAGNELTDGGVGKGILGVGDTAGDAVGGLKGLFATPTFDSDAEKAAYEEKQKRQMLQHNRMMALMSGDGESTPAGPPASRQTVTLDGQLGQLAPPSDMTIAANAGFEPIPNPDYDPNDPSSQQFIVNPTYAQLLAHQQSKKSIGMAAGGFANAPPNNNMFDGTYGPKIIMDSPFGAEFTNNFQSLGAPLGSPINPYARPATQPSGGQPFKQYGQYLEQTYGEPDFEQKRDQFLQEVSQKEQQTFQDGGMTPPLHFGGNIEGPESPQGDGSYWGGSRPPVPSGVNPFASSGVNPFASGRLPFPQNIGMAEGGELEVAPPEGGNEKTMISDAVRAVKGELPEEQSKVVLGQFLANYGEEALRDLVDKVQSGEMDDTVERFANGKAGEVNGPGDGSGVDDKVPASLEGQQDVLLADGEFVLRKKTADALEKKYGGGFLDAVNKAESAAPKTMQQYMARN